MGPGCRIAVPGVAPYDDAMPTTTETAFNVELANALRTKHPRWREGERIGAEQTGVFLGHPGLQPDIVIRHPGGAPVVVETEFEPAATVEADARARLGMKMADSGDVVDQAIAVRVPESLRSVDQGVLAQHIAEAPFEYCVLTRRDAEPEDPDRWPEEGWLAGGIDELAGLIEQTALSERRIAEGMAILEDGVSQAARRLRSDLEDRPEVLAKIAEELHQEDGEQTSRMAMAIVANALTVHTAIAGAFGIATLDELRDSRERLSKSKVLRTWRRILRDINYWPIFKIASDVLLPIPDGVARRALERLHGVAAELDGIGATSTQDLAGQMFGRLITDRKFLATFYTLPSSAALLAELAVSRLEVDWSDPDEVKKLRIADLACGTGVLLSAAYRAVAARHRRAGGDDADLHRDMIEDALIGADIMPAATHLTASMLSSAHPTVTFGRTRIHTMPYGRQDDSTNRPVAIGSLDLIASDTQPSLFGTGEHVLTGFGEAIEVEDYTQRGDEIRLPHGSADLVIMNPPFIRPTNHAAGREMPVPSFAGFGTSHDEQREMSKVLRGIRSGLQQPASHGHAGLASNFLDLAHAKVKPGGVIALVLPVAVLSGQAWSAARALLERDYRNLAVVTLATTGQTDRAFSADTGIAEALVVATRSAPSSSQDSDADALYLNLRSRPPGTAEGIEIARLLSGDLSEGAGLFDIGSRTIGCYIGGSLADGGCAQLREPHVAETAIALRDGNLRLPHTRGLYALPIATLGDLGVHGLHDLDIYGTKRDGTPQGPFEIISRGEGTPTYAVLWAHHAARERRLVVEPDSEGRVRPRQEEDALDVWETATRIHFNRDFRLNSQSLAACLTPGRSIGGRAWPNFSVEGDERREEALALWVNTTLGLICFWWVGGRQQQGRSILTISGLPRLPVLDVRALSDSQLGLARAIFSEFAERDLLPANEAYRDATRTSLDRAVLCELLGLPESILEPLDVLRLQWCSEPTVHGGKSTRPA